MAERPEVLHDGRSPAPRAIGELLQKLREAGATAISPRCCATCGKHLRTLTRKGQDWYCGPCQHRRAACAGCGQTKRVKALDRDGRPRCAQCADLDDRDPIAVIHAGLAELDPGVGYDTIAAVVGRSCQKRAYQQKLAWAIESDPALLTGDAHRAPLRVIPRFVEHLHAAGVGGVVLPTCPGCRRVVRIDKPLGGVRVCRTCIAHSRREECARCGAHREPVTREQGRPICANCFICDPANLEACIGCGRRLSIHPNQARSTALFQLATQIPAATLARTLGISVSTAVRWQQISAGDWASYAADVSNRSRPQRADPASTTDYIG